MQTSIPEIFTKNVLSADMIFADYEFIRSQFPLLHFATTENDRFVIKGILISPVHHNETRITIYYPEDYPYSNHECHVGVYDMGYTCFGSGKYPELFFIKNFVDDSFVNIDLKLPCNKTSYPISYILSAIMTWMYYYETSLLNQ